MKFTTIDKYSSYINLVNYPNRISRTIHYNIPPRITVEQLHEHVEVIISKEYINEVETYPFGTAFTMKFHLSTELELKEIGDEIFVELLKELNDYISNNLPEYVKSFQPVTIDGVKPRIIINESK